MISANYLEKESKENIKAQSQMQKLKKAPNSFQFKEQIKNEFTHKQYEESLRKEGISSQLATLKKENEELKR